MENFVIHIFGYGDTQLITNEKNLKHETKNLTKVQPLVDAIWNLKPEDYSGEKKFHVINLFGKNDIRWINENSFKLNNESLSTMIDELITEIQEYKNN